MDSRQHQADKIYRTTSIGTENQQIKINKYENQIHFILINRGLSIGIMCHGDTITIKKGVKHAVRAISELTFIEVQSGNLLAEEDIEQFDYKW